MTISKEKLIQNNTLIAEFLGWRKSTYEHLGRYINKQKGYEKITADCFTLPESHPIVQNIYTDTPAYTWQDSFRCDDLTDEEGRHLVFDPDMDLRFHESWDWLVPVIDKIYSMDEYYDYKLETSGQFENEIEINTKFIYRTHEDVIEFIEWFNENKKI